MGKLRYLFVHAASTPFGRDLTPDDIDLWHLGAKNHGDGTMTYLGKRQPIEKLEGLYLKLPSGKEVLVTKTNGRGWKSRGYADLLKQSGELVNLTPYDFDDQITSMELTNGARGYNSNARHIVLPGGYLQNGELPTKENLAKPEELYNDKVLKGLVDYLKMQKELVPGIQIKGHNEVAKKSCPGFDVQEFIHKHNI